MFKRPLFHSIFLDEAFVDGRLNQAFNDQSITDLQLTCTESSLHVLCYILIKT